MILKDLSNPREIELISDIRSNPGTTWPNIWARVGGNAITPILKKLVESGHIKKVGNGYYPYDF